MQTALIIIHVVIAVVLTVIVLMQHGKQQGLSGAIAGGAETFFGKNKGRTVDAMLKKFTAVMAILFIASSVTLTGVSINQYSSQNATQGSTSDAASQTLSTDEAGNIVDQDGNIIMTAEDMQAQQAQQAESGDANAAPDANTAGEAAPDANTAENAQQATQQNPVE